MQGRLKAGALAVIVIASAALAACSSGGSKKKFAYVERPVEQIYSEATERLERKRWDEAIELFAEVERQHPYSPWARRAMLMRAFARYQTNDYDEAIEALDQFITLHPGNKDAPYAYYLKAMCYYERISAVGRDQENTDNALNSLNDVIRRYPNSEYARDARLKLDLTYNHLAGKEMYVGRYYLKQLKHIAAINRFNYVVEKYQTTDHVPEALYRLVEAYLQIGVIEEARAAAAVLGANYAGSVWYDDAYKLFSRYKLMDAEGRPIEIARKTPSPSATAGKPELGSGRDLARPPVEADEAVPEALPNQ
jgi:outer membrane protein assembly factor BamD